MSEIKVDINLLKDLRNTTGISYNDCKNALIEANNDFQKALEILKIKGLSKAQAKLSNIVGEGITKILVDKNTAVIGELNCQTDFVANNIEFTNLMNQVLVTILKHQPKDITSALQLKINHNETLNDLILHSISKLGENISLKRFEIIKKNNDEVFGTYVHTGGISAGIIVLAGTNNHDVAVDMAMQLVAMNPKYIDVKDVDPEIAAKERKVAEEQVKGIKKPAEILEKMVSGKFNKALSELTIVNQSFIKEPNITVAHYLKQNNATIKYMIRYKVGELA